MEIKDQTVTTDTDSEGNEIVTEINATYTETLADGTEVSADITTTADADDPTQMESQMTVTETAPDGTETVTEVISNEDGTFIVEDESLLEEAFEATFDVEIGDDLTPVTPGEEFSADASPYVFSADSDFQTTDSDFTVGDEIFDSSLLPVDAPENQATNAPFDPVFETAEPALAEAPVADGSTEPAAFETYQTDANEISETESTEFAEQEAHVQAATDAQEAADAFIAEGDYAAAAEAREVAEDESWQAGDDSMLSLYDAQDLTTAAEKQEDAENYSQQQAEFARAGDYEAAREAASDAAYATSDADILAGGADHTGEADAQFASLDNAVWQEGLAEDDLENAAWHAEMGNFDQAESSLDSAAANQADADYYGDLGEPGGDIAIYDPSSEVATGGAYDSTFDATAVDTGFDSSVDTTASSSFDTGTDDV